MDTPVSPDMYAHALRSSQCDACYFAFPSPPLHSCWTERKMGFSESVDVPVCQASDKQLKPRYALLIHPLEWWPSPVGGMLDGDDILLICQAVKVWSVYIWMIHNIDVRQWTLEFPHASFRHPASYHTSYLTACMSWNRRPILYRVAMLHFQCRRACCESILQLLDRANQATTWDWAPSNPTWGIRGIAESLGTCRTGTRRLRRLGHLDETYSPPPSWILHI
jgi:hypothetical protein